jgi:hypothetical protein
MRYFFANKMVDTRLRQGRDFEDLEISKIFKKKAGLFKETRKSGRKRRNEK